VAARRQERKRARVVKKKVKQVRRKLVKKQKKLKRKVRAFKQLVKAAVKSLPDEDRVQIEAMLPGDRYAELVKRKLIPAKKLNKFMKVRAKLHRKPPVSNATIFKKALPKPAPKWRKNWVYSPKSGWHPRRPFKRFIGPGRLPWGKNARPVTAREKKLYGKIGAFGKGTPLNKLRYRWHRIRFPWRYPWGRYRYVRRNKTKSRCCKSRLFCGRFCGGNRCCRPRTFCRNYCLETAKNATAAATRAEGAAHALTKYNLQQAIRNTREFAEHAAEAAARALKAAERHRQAAMKEAADFRKQRAEELQKRGPEQDKADKVAKDFAAEQTVKQQESKAQAQKADVDMESLRKEMAMEQKSKAAATAEAKLLKQRMHMKEQDHKTKDLKRTARRLRAEKVQEKKAAAIRQKMQDVFRAALVHDADSYKSRTANRVAEKEAAQREAQQEKAAVSIQLSEAKEKAVKKDAVVAQKQYEKVVEQWKERKLVQKESGQVTGAQRMAKLAQQMLKNSAKRNRAVLKEDARERKELRRIERQDYLRKQEKTKEQLKERIQKLKQQQAARVEAQHSRITQIAAAEAKAKKDKADAYAEKTKKTQAKLDEREKAWQAKQTVIRSNEDAAKSMLKPTEKVIAVAAELKRRQAVEAAHRVLTLKIQDRLKARALEEQKGKALAAKQAKAADSARWKRQRQRERRMRIAAWRMRQAVKKQMKAAQRAFKATRRALRKQAAIVRQRIKAQLRAGQLKVAKAARLMKAAVSRIALKKQREAIKRRLELTAAKKRTVKALKAKRKAESAEEQKEKSEDAQKAALKKELQNKEAVRRRRMEQSNKRHVAASRKAFELRQKKTAEMLAAERRRIAEVDTKARARVEVRAKELAAKAKAREEKQKAWLRKLHTAGGLPIALSKRLKPLTRGYRYPLYTVLGNVCVLSGVVNGTNLYGKLGRLPLDCRPKQRHIFSTRVGKDRLLRVDVTPAGWIVGRRDNSDMLSVNASSSKALVSDPSKLPKLPGSLSLEAVSFPVASAQLKAVPLQKGWKNFGGRFQNLSVFQNGDLCMLSGLVRLQSDNIAKWPAHIANLPISCRPLDGRLSFRVFDGSEPHRVDILPSGRVLWVVGNRRNSWLSLSGVSFFTASTTNPITLLNGWRSFKRGYRVPSWRAQGPLVVLSGMASVDSFSGHIATLPRQARPSARLSFTTTHDKDTWQLEVLPNGRIVFVSGPNSSFRDRWVSLDGVSFLLGFVRKYQSPLQASTRRSLPLLPGFTPATRLPNPFGRGKPLNYQGPKFTVMGPLCLINGMARGSDIHKSWAALPAQCTPAQRIVRSAVTPRGQTLRVDVLPNGRVKFVSGPAGLKRTAFSFESLLLPSARAKGTPIKLSGHWLAYSQGFAAPQFFRVGELCMLSGRLRLPAYDLRKWSDLLTVLPAACRPADGRMSFTVNHGNVSMSIDVSVDGSVRYSGGDKAGKAWVSLDGIAFFTSHHKRLSLAASWRTERVSAWRKPSWRRSGSLCMLGGRIEAGRNRNLASVGARCRPARRLSFASRGPSGLTRIDVLPSGQIVAVGRGKLPPFIHFDGIAYGVDQTQNVVRGPKFGRVQVRQVRIRDAPSASNRTSSAVSAPGSAKVAPRFKYSAPGRKSPYRLPQYYVLGSVCALNGRVVGSGWGEWFARLPRHCRPDSRLVFETVSDRGAITRIDIDRLGRVSVAGGSRTTPWITLDGIAFKIAGYSSTPLKLHGYWRAAPKASKLAAPSIRKEGELCVASGLVHLPNFNTKQWNPLIATLPAECRPRDGDLTFAVNSDGFSQRVSVRTNGDIVWRAGNNRLGWLSLDGISFFPLSKTRTLMLKSGATPKASTDRVPSIRRQGRFCALSGSLRLRATANKIATLPGDCKPKTRMSFLVNHNEYSLRVDLLPNGDIRVADGPRKHPWLSLDGIRYSMIPRMRGIRLPPLTGFPARAGRAYRPYGHNFNRPQFFKDGQVCAAFGVVQWNRRARFANRKIVARFDKRCRPAHSLRFNSFIESKTGPLSVALEMSTKGVVKIVGGPVPPRDVPLSLDSLAFLVKGNLGRPLNLSATWGPATGTAARGSEPATVYAQNGMCVLSGLVATTETDQSKPWPPHIGTLAKECWPDKRLVFSVSSGAHTHRIDITDEGKVLWVIGDKTSPSVSLNGIQFYPKAGSSLAVSAEWEPLTGYRTPSVNKVGRFCTVSGVVQIGANKKPAFAQLPTGCHPAGKLIFFANQHATAVRIDVLANGTMLWTANPSVNQEGWISLDGIHLIAKGKRVKVRTPAITRLGDMQLLRNFQPAIGFAPAQWLRHGRVCLLTGSASAPPRESTSDDDPFAVLPWECRPSRKIAVSTHLNGTVMARAVVDRLGKVRWSNSSTRLSAMSFSGAVFPVRNAFSTPVKPALPWINYGQGYKPLGFLVQDGLCVLTGRIQIVGSKLSDWTEKLAVLPAACRPDGTVAFLQNQNSVAYRIDVAKDGTVSYRGDPLRPAYVDLDGVTFTTFSKTVIKLNAEFAPFGGEYRVPSLSKLGPMCVLSGAAKVNKQGDHIATLPAHCRPRVRLSFTTAAGTKPARIDVLPDGSVLWDAAAPGRWLSLDNIRFAARKAGRSL